MPNQLPPTITPHRYALHFTVDLQAFRFTCTETITVEITEQTSLVRLHCEGLEVSEVELRDGDTAVAVSHECVDGELRVVPQTPLAPGTYEFSCACAGPLTDDLSGFYRSRYIDADGNEAFLATTQFEAPYARKAFPCFDEPRFKAAFALTLTVAAGMTAVSNMPVASETVQGDTKDVVFDDTPHMSTYLLYMGVGAFDWIETERGSRAVRVYGVNGQSARGAFACEFAADTLAFFEEYSGIDYPLPKLDLLAIPDFAAGAMENWGAVTFREVLLYADEETTSLPVRKRIAEVVAHELWHQWSGNLVTMEWWDDLWLNEAFATYIAYKAVDHFYPEWQIWDDFIDGDTCRAFGMDMLQSTHPIAVPVHTPNEVEEIFDHISYGKGGSVLRMIEHFIGPEAFRAGVSAYLREQAYGNARADDLWNTLEKHSTHPVRDLLVTWVTRPGFPLLQAATEGTALRISQQRFSCAVEKPREQPWPVPLTWWDRDGAHAEVFSEGDVQISATGPSAKLNAGQAGFYRVLYAPEHRQRLAEAVQGGALERIDRWGLIDDLWACVFAGYAPLSDLLEFLDCFGGEQESFVLRELHGVCDAISRHLRSADRGTALFERIRTAFAAAHDRLGFNPSTDDSAQDRELRPLALSHLIRAGDSAATDHARSLAEAYLAGGAIDPDMRRACLLAVTHTGARDACDTVRAAYERATDVEERLVLLHALGAFADTALLREHLDYALTDAVRRQDLRRVFASAGTNPTGSQVFGSWVRDNWDVLYRLRESHFVYMGLLQTFIATAPDRAALLDVSRFLADNSDGFEKTQANAVERAEIALAFRERERRDGSVG